MDRDDLKKILVIDNSKTTCECMKALFHENGFSCVRISDANIGREIIDDHKPDLVIVDLSLPRVQAPEILASIRDNQLLAGTPTLMISRHGAARDKLMAYAFGANSFLTKPIEKKALMEEINRLIKRRNAVCC